MDGSIQIFIVKTLNPPKKTTNEENLSTGVGIMVQGIHVSNLSTNQSNVFSWHAFYEDECQKAEFGQLKVLACIFLEQSRHLEVQRYSLSRDKPKEVDSIPWHALLIP